MNATSTAALASCHLSPQLWTVYADVQTTSVRLRLYIWVYTVVVRDRNGDRVDPLPALHNFAMLHNVADGILR